MCSFFFGFTAQLKGISTKERVIVSFGLVTNWVNNCVDMKGLWDNTVGMFRTREGSLEYLATHAN